MSYEVEEVKKHYLLEYEGPTHPVHLPLAVRDAHPVTGAPLVLLLALALRAKTSNDFRRCSCFPAYAMLAKDTGLSIKTLKRAANELEQRGLIHRDTRMKRSNIWHVNAIKIWAMARAEHAKEVAADEAWKAEWEAQRAEATSFVFDSAVDTNLSDEDQAQQGTPKASKKATSQQTVGPQQAQVAGHSPVAAEPVAESTPVPTSSTTHWVGDDDDDDDRSVTPVASPYPDADDTSEGGEESGHFPDHGDVHPDGGAQ
jgi:hypothetical protein